jgi:hypothetical protein
MKLCIPMVIELSKALKSSASAETKVKQFFSQSKSAFGYHAGQLVEKHGLPFKNAVFASAFLNAWLQFLGARDLDPITKKRMELCVFSYSALSKYVTACNSKLCPICRTVKVMHVSGLLDHLPPVRVDFMKAQVVGDLPRLKRRPGALLTVRNVVRDDAKLVLQQVMLFPEPGAPGLAKDAILGLLRYDFSLLNDKPLLDLWLQSTKRMKFFSRAQK